MQMRTKLPIISLVGAGALLLTLLAVIIAPRPQIAHAQSPMVTIEWSTYNGTMTQGGQLFAKYTFRNVESLTCNKNSGTHHTSFDDPCYYRSEISVRDSNTPACGGVSGDRSFSQSGGNTQVFGFSRNQIPASCPVGEYTLKVILMHSTKEEAAFSTADFEVIAAPTATPTNTPQPYRPPPPPPPPPPTATPTATPTEEPTATPTATSTDTPTPTATTEGGSQEQPLSPQELPLGEATATPTATPTPTPTATTEGESQEQQLIPQQLPLGEATATPTATPTPTPTVEGNGQGNNGGNQGNQQNNQPGNNGGNQGNNNQGRSNNQGGNNQGGNKQGGVNVQSFISNPTPLPSYSPQQYQAPLAITIPEIMNVRTGPGLTYDIVTTVPAGTQGTIVGIDPDDDWYQVEIDGIEGQVWIYQDLTTLVGSVVGVKRYTALEIAQLTSGTPAADGSVPLAITIPELMNVRTGPGLTYNIVTTVPAGTQGYIYGIDPDNDWFHIELEGFDTRVWVYQDLTTVVGSLASVKLYTAAEIALLLSGSGADGSIPLAITVPITMNVRTGPGLLYDIVGIVPKGTQGRIFGIDPNNDWFQIELEAFDTLVWVYQDLTTVIGSLAGVKWVTEAELALLPAAITQPLLLNARAGPGLTYDILTTIPQGTWMKIVGIDTLGEWYRVELPDLNQQAWIFRDYTKVAGGTLSGLIQLALSGNPPPNSRLTSSITVALSLPPAGGVDLEVSWVDLNACAHLYNLYHRASPDTTVYISLEQAATSSTANSKSLSFSTLSGSSFISAWCGSMAGGREVAEVEIDPGVAGTYSSTTTSGGLATVPDTDDGSR